MENKQLPKIEGEPYVHQAFPMYCTGPDGQGANFETEAEVPAGWKMAGGKVKGGKSEPKENPVTEQKVSVQQPVTETPGSTEAVELDGSGAPWNAEIHRSTKSKNKAGLWHLKVGATRPPVDETPLDL